MSLAETTPDSVGTRAFPGTWRSRYSRRLVLLDAAVITVALLTAQWLRFGVLPTDHPERLSGYTAVSAVIGVVWWAALSANRSHSTRIIGAGLEEYRRVVTTTMAVFGGVAIVSMVFKLGIARGYLVIAFLGLFGVLVGRYIARRVVRGARLRQGHCMTRVLVVGNLSAVADLVRCMTRDAEAGFDVVAACVPGHPPRSDVTLAGLLPIPVPNGVPDILDVLAVTGCDAVALTATDLLDSRDIRDLSWHLEKLDVELMVSPGVVDVSSPRLTFKPVAGLPLIHVEKPQYSGAQRFQKRAFDLVFAATVLLVTSPLLAVVAVAVKLTSSGPVFYRSERIGRDGTPFQMIKFRTMIDGADEMIGTLAGF
ncbi:MAG: Undecaprenyl-phosphate galactose phosphotransferase, partial [Mycobacterium sp.]|nr:Undecaprenyl-phosphate galactose phosphotransferase [Mycobacterium sp.]